MPLEASRSPERKVAILGTGQIAALHAKAVQANAPRTKLSGVADVDLDRAKAFAKEFGVSEAYDDPQRLLNELRPDLVCISTPPAPHAALSIAAMRHGADVFCEKPMCASLQEVDQVLDACLQTGRSCASVFQMRFGPSSMHLAGLIQSGLLGKPLVAIAQTTWYRAPAYYDVPWRGKWATELGGPTMGHGIHNMDHLLHFLGPWSEVRAAAGRLDRAIEVEDTSMAIACFENGAMASIINSILCPREESRIRIDFQRATAELVHLYTYTRENWQLKVVDEQADAGLLEAWNQMPADRAATHAWQLTTYLDDLDNGRPHPTSGSGARNTIEFLTAIYKASFTGQPVARGSIIPGDPFYEHIHGNHRFPGT